MNCLETDLIFQKFFDGEISPGKSSSVSRHLLGCSSCAREFDKVKREMRDLIVDTAEPQLDPDRLLKKVAAGIKGIRPRHPLPMAPVSVAGSLILAFGFSLYFFESRPGNPEIPIPKAEQIKADIFHLSRGSRIQIEPGGKFLPGSPPQLLAGTAILEVAEDSRTLALATPVGYVESTSGKFRIEVFGESALPKRIQEWAASPSPGSVVSVLALQGKVRIRGTLSLRDLEEGETGVFTQERFGGLPSDGPGKGEALPAASKKEH